MNETPDMLSTALKMLAALGLVLGGLGVFFFFAKKVMHKNIGGNQDKLIHILANQYLGMKKNISAVQVPGAILIIGISGDSIRLLTEIKDKEVLDQFKKQASGNMSPSFSDHLNKITSRFMAPRDGD